MPVLDLQVLSNLGGCVGWTCCIRISAQLLLPGAYGPYKRGSPTSILLEINQVLPSASDSYEPGIANLLPLLVARLDRLDSFANARIVVSSLMPRRIPVIVPVSVVLRAPDDWDEWHEVLSVKARGLSVWDYINETNGMID